MKWWKHKSGTPEHIDFRLTSHPVWDRDYRPHLLKVDRERLDVTGAKNELEKRKAQGYWTHYGHLFIWENMRQSMGDICMYESLIADPEWIHDYNRVHTDLFKAHFKILIEEAGKPDGFWFYEDLGYRNGLFCSPRTLEEMIFPYYKEMVDFFHSYDIPVVLHACGGITDAVPLIVEAGFDGLNPMEVKAGCNTLKFAERYGDRLTFFGGLDARVLESGDRALIRIDASVCRKGSFVGALKGEDAVCGLFRHVGPEEYAVVLDHRVAHIRGSHNAARNSLPSQHGQSPILLARARIQPAPA